MAALTTFINSCKTLDLRNALINDLGTNLISQAIADACLEYSEYNPRGFRTATITIAEGDTEILLPADCRMIDEDTAYLLYYGSSRGRYRVPGGYPAHQNLQSSADRNSPLYSTTDPPSSESQVDPIDIPISTNTAGRLSILLTNAATSQRSHAIRYEAIHTITNTPDVNTIPLHDQRKVRKLVLGYLADARRRQALQEENVALAKEFQSAANEYFQVRDEFIGAMGGIY